MQALNIPSKHKESIEDLVSHIFEEARMVLPGIQALLGFQLVAVFNQGFKDLSVWDKNLHLFAIFLSVNAICFLLTPAAIHRQCHPEKLTNGFARIASKLICLGMMPLLLSIVLDSYVVFNLILASPILAFSFAAVLLIELTFCWIIWPRLRREKNKHVQVDC